MLERVGVLTDEVSENIVEALDRVRANGLRHVEVRFVNGKNVADLSDTELADLRFEVEKRDLFISCIASPLFKCALDPREVASGDTFGQTEVSIEAHFSKLDRVVDICKQLQTDKVRIFSFRREKDPEAHEKEIIQHVKRAARVAEKAGIYLLLENSPHVKILWDPGNEVHGGRSAYPEGYQAVKGLIGQVHLKDAYVDEDEVFVSPLVRGSPFYRTFTGSAEGRLYRFVYNRNTLRTRRRERNAGYRHDIGWITEAREGNCYLIGERISFASNSGISKKG